MSATQSLIPSPNYPQLTSVPMLGLYCTNKVAELVKKKIITSEAVQALPAFPPLAEQVNTWKMVVDDAKGYTGELKLSSTLRDVSRLHFFLHSKNNFDKSRDTLNDYIEDFELGRLPIPIQAVKMFVDRGASFWDPLMVASAEGNVEKLKELTSNLQDSPTCESLSTPIDVAISFGQIETLKYLRTIPAIVSECDLTLPEIDMMIAAAEGDMEKLEALIKDGVNLHKESRNGWSALKLATRFEQTEAMKLILRGTGVVIVNDVDELISFQESEIGQAVSYAYHSHKFKAMDVLAEYLLPSDRGLEPIQEDFDVQEAEEDEDDQRISHLSWLTYLACKLNQTQATLNFLNQRSRVNSIGQHIKDFPLFYIATKNKNEELMKKLLPQGEDLYSRYNYDDDYDRESVNSVNWDLGQELIRAEKYETFEKYLMKEAKYDVNHHFLLMDVLLKNYCVTFPDAQLRQFNFLLKMGADFYKTDILHHSVLYYAYTQCCNGTRKEFHKNIINLLIKQARGIDNYLAESIKRDNIEDIFILLKLRNELEEAELANPGATEQQESDIANRNMLEHPCFKFALKLIGLEENIEFDHRPLRHLLATKSRHEKDKHGHTALYYLYKTCYDQKGSSRKLEFYSIVLENLIKEAHGVDNYLMEAAKLGTDEDVNILLRLKANPNTVDQSGFSSFRHAFRNGHFDVVKTLAPFSTDLVDAFERRDYQYCRGLLSGHGFRYTLNLNQRDKFGNTGLHFAVFAPERGLLDELLKAGANPNTANNLGNTPLMNAAVYYADKLPVLVEHGADPLLRNIHGESALDLAKKHGNTQSQRYLESIVEPPTSLFTTAVNYVASYFNQAKRRRL